MTEEKTPIQLIKEDRILNAYHVGETTHRITESKFICYDASGFFSPISIRDQIIRVCLIIERAKEQGIISSERPILIVGGGVAGVTAAIKAVELGVKTVLVDSQTLLISLIQSTRHFCPVQYDWSVEHWDKGKFPYSISLGNVETTPFSDSIPVNLVEGEVEKSMMTLKTQIELFSKKYSSEPNTLNFYENVTLKDHDFIQKGNDLPLLTTVFTRKALNENLIDDDIKLPDVCEYGMGFSCVGFGKEKVSISDKSKFRGIDFWNLIDHDKLLTNATVLICGSGDGALQDFLLLATKRKTTKEIYRLIRDGEDANTKQLFDEVESIIRKAEEEAKRKEIWHNLKNDSGMRNLCQIYRELHTIHKDAVRRLLGLQHVQSKLKNLVVKEVTQGKLIISYLCNHFSACYPFNRFLALLIGEYVANYCGEPKSVFLDMTSVKEISSANNSHECSKNADACAKYVHKVRYARDCTCCNIEGIIDARREHYYRRIIVRYGIAGPKVIFGGEPNSPGLQYLPYTLP
jgi:hypothetical protein